MIKEHKSIDIEKAVLGLLISNNKSLIHSVNYLKPEDFFDVKHQLIYSTLIDLVENNIKIEMAAIVNSLKTSGNFIKIGKENYLGDLLQSAALESNLTKFMKVISDNSHLRRVRKKLISLSKEFDKDDIEATELLENLETEILESTREVGVREFEHSKKIIQKTIENIKLRISGSHISGLATEWDELNKITSGLQKGDLIILAARPSMGKTAFALNLAKTISEKNTVAFFSLEMTKEQLMERVLSSMSYIDGYKFKSNSLSKTDWIKITQSEKKISKMNLFIDDTPGLTLSELIWKSKKQHNIKKLDLILIDYMQLIDTQKVTRGENRQAEVSAISRGLKKLARELNIPVIAISQLSRRVEQREDKRPLMSDIRESGAIEQDADLIMFLYRENYYKKNTSDSEDTKNQLTEIIISKHRNGATGKIDVIFDPSIGLFKNKPQGEH